MGVKTVNHFTSELTNRFKQLQSKLRDRWQSFDTFDQDDYDILVVPSYSIDQYVGQKVAGFLHYEERLLFSLIRLRNPHTRVIYVTALPLCPIVIDYYLQLLPGIPFSHARDRLLLLSTYDASLKPCFQSATETWANFSGRIPELGAIVEAFVEGIEKRSPSVQGYIKPSGEVEILSTHDQILGGADNQIYLGCYFPAAADYRLQLQELGIKVGQALAAKGAMERYGVDFITVRQPGTDKWDIQAIEINLRKGGTTHPFMTLKFLTNGTYDYTTGKFLSQQGQPKYYIASDNLQKQQYRGLLPNDLMDIIAQERLHFDSSTRTGSVFHLMGALSEFGKLGLTSIGDSLEQAQAIYARVEAVLDKETERIDESKQISSLPISWEGTEKNS